jgi:hypothetical protein
MARRTNHNQPNLVRFSAAMTNRGRLLAVVLAVDPTSTFSATALQSRIAGSSVDKISKELRQLETMGLVEEVESDAATVDFQITSKKAWRALCVLAECAKSELIEVP